MPRENGFYLRLLLSFVVCVGAWYLLGRWMVWPPGVIARTSLELGFPGWVAQARLDGTVFELVTRIPLAGAAPPGTMHFRSNMLSACLGTPIAVALFCSHASGHRLRKILLALVFLVPLQAAGIAAFLLVQVSHAAGADAVTGFDNYDRDAFAYCFQLASLILPFVSPLAAWLFFEWRAFPSPQTTLRKREPC